MSFAEKIQQQFSVRSFLIGLLAVLVLYAALFAYLFLSQGKTLEALESALATQIVVVERAASSQNIIDETAAAPSPTPAPEEQQEESPEDIIQKQSLALREAPIEGFYEETLDGKLPIAMNETQTPFRVYKKPFILNQNTPYAAIAILNFGLSVPVSESMIAELPSEVSFILSPYSAQPEEWIQKARADGHEVWLQMPIENNQFPFDDPGAKGLLTRVSLKYNQQRLDWLLGRATGYAGIAAYSDSALANATPMFKSIAQSIFKRGLGFLELNQSNDSFISPLADEDSVPHTKSFETLETLQPREAKVKRALQKIMLNGAVVTVKPSETNITALKLWIDRLQRDNIILAPVSAVATLGEEE